MEWNGIHEWNYKDGMADLDYAGVKVEWQQVTLTTNSNP